MKKLLMLKVLIFAILSLPGCQLFNDNIKTHKVIFLYSEESEYKRIEVNNNQSISKPSVPKKEGHEFIGWFIDSELEYRWNFDEYTVTKDLYLYVGWETLLYTLTFDANGGTISEKEYWEGSGEIVEKNIRFNTDIGLLPRSEHIKKKGYNFDGWIADSNKLLSNTVYLWSDDKYATAQWSKKIDTFEKISVEDYGINTNLTNAKIAEDAVKDNTIDINFTIINETGVDIFLRFEFALISDTENYLKTIEKTEALILNAENNNIGYFDQWAYYLDAFSVSDRIDLRSIIPTTLEDYEIIEDYYPRLSIQALKMKNQDIEDENCIVEISQLNYWKQIELQEELENSTPGLDFKLITLPSSDYEWLHEDKTGYQLSGVKDGYNIENSNLKIPALYDDGQNGIKEVISIKKGVEISASSWEYKSKFYNYDIDHIFIPSTVEKIENYSFFNINFETIKLEEGIKQIGEGAFAAHWDFMDYTQMKYLTKEIEEVIIPDSTEVLDRWIFTNRHIKKLDIGAISKIGEESFWGAGIANLKLSEGIKNIGDWAFSAQSKDLSGMITNEIIIPSTVRDIGDGAFYNRNVKKIFFKHKDGIDQLALSNEWDAQMWCQCVDYKRIEIPSGYLEKYNNHAVLGDDAREYQLNEIE